MNRIAYLLLATAVVCVSVNLWPQRPINILYDKYICWTYTPVGLEKCNSLRCWVITRVAPIKNDCAARLFNSWRLLQLPLDSVSFSFAWNKSMPAHRVTVLRLQGPSNPCCPILARVTGPQHRTVWGRRTVYDAKSVSPDDTLCLAKMRLLLRSFLQCPN